MESKDTEQKNEKTGKVAGTSKPIEDKQTDEATSTTVEKDAGPAKSTETSDKPSKEEINEMRQKRGY